VFLVVQEVRPSVRSFGTRAHHAAVCAVALRDHGQATVAELADRTGLSRPTVEAGLETMADRGLVSVLDGLTTGGRGVGRPARLYAFRSAAGHAVAVDVGVHRIRVAVADLSGRPVGWHEEATAPGTVGPIRMATVMRAVSRCLADVDVAATSLVGMGVAVTGMVGPDGRLIVSKNLPDWEGVDIAGHLQREYDCPVVVDNDIRMAALAEHRLGAARLVDDVVYLFAGHRVSMGLILGGELRHGRHSAAGEIGGIAFSMSVDDRQDQLRWTSADSGIEVFRRAADGDPAAVAEVREFAQGLATGVATVAMAIDPDMIVIGGGLSQAGGVLLDPLRQAVNAAIPVPVMPSIVASELGAESVLLGTLVRAFGVTSAPLYGSDNLPEPVIDIGAARTLASEAVA
jgi:predicted NBD/HSP70 family sugar kinase